MDNNASTGCGTRLQVTHRTPNSCINLAKLLIEPFRNPLNRLKVVGLRLEENTLHRRIIVSMQRHHLDIMADVLHRVRFPIVGIERWACKSTQHLGPFNVV